jgi:hypothetical protein
MVLLHQIVQVLRGPDLGVLGKHAVFRHLTNRAMRSRGAIERDGFWRLALMLDGLLEKCFCCGHVAFGAEHEVYCLACPIHRSIKVDPFATQFDIRLIDTPGLTGGRAKTVPAFDEFGRIALHSTQDRGVRQRQSTLGHHFHQISQAELVAQVPANTQDDHLAIKVPPREELLQTLKLTHRRLSNSFNPRL